ncbi:MAG TPA: 4-hydroxy-3-methylbut-2-enyl diphosphate reductase, partial [Methylophilaceae bacterium]|nr:4-hydroxy-3-methylbut-2-enyl diphosphate reductase [Methylophilaceae bacterium]
RLREVAQNQGIEAYMVDDASHLDLGWTKGKKRIGVSAGASAPEVLVKEVIAKLQTLDTSEVIELQGVVENVVFQLPKNLTTA